ncbi:MAG: hypothetical protein GF390_00555 [Candidatus Pacebacteria bacterium]|nr:hypothetical protein [Candidatus Paceibacterota bacterium]
MKTKLPLTSKNLIRLLVALIVILSLTAGYYHSLWKTERKKYKRLEDMYVRVRGELGREETQRLIDLSHEKEADF